MNGNDIFQFRLPKKLIDARTIKRKADCCLLLGAIEKSYQDYRRVADVLKSQNDTIWHAGLFNQNIRISSVVVIVFFSCIRSTCSSKLCINTKTKTSHAKNDIIFKTKFRDEKY